jgi:5-methyltetrahydrofolate--homocysteine methyltransferase
LAPAERHPQVRLNVARKILGRAADHGLAPEDLLFDPLVLTVGADSVAARATLETLRLLRREIGVNTVSGASNVSFGLPDRPTLNSAFVAMAIAVGLTAAITNPLEPMVHTAIAAADLLMGHDEYAGRWIRGFRKREKAKGTPVAPRSH